MKGETQRNERGWGYFRVVDGEGGVLADCLAERQARHFLKVWNERPLARDRPAQLVALDLMAEQRPMTTG